MGPQTFRQKAAPRFVSAEITIIAMLSLAIVDLLLIWAWLKYQNVKKEVARKQPGYVKRKGVEYLDLTDRENPEFVYSL